MIPLDQLTILIEQNLPNTPYEKAHELRRVTDFAETLAATARDRYNQEIAEIIRQGITSTDYCIITPLRYVREPDTRKLKTELPEVYESIVYIPAYHAEKILGRPAILTACRQTDPERTATFVAVNLGDLKMRLTTSEYAEYTKVRTVPGEPELRRTGDAS